MKNASQLKWLRMTRQWVCYWVKWADDWSLSKSGHGMVHLLLIVNPSPSLQFLRDPGLVSHTLSRCCLNNKPLTPRLELRYMTITARWALYLKIKKCHTSSILLCDLSGRTWQYGNLRENVKTSKQRHQNQNGNDDLELKWSKSLELKTVCRVLHYHKKVCVCWKLLPPLKNYLSLSSYLEAVVLLASGRGWDDHNVNAPPSSGREKLHRYWHRQQT